MVAYQDFVALSQSRDSEERGRAAHLAAMAYLNHHGPADEHAALYAALIGFLDDPSVRVRGALAYGLLHAMEAPRPILLALLQDSPIIARAVAQYSPSLVDADLMAVIPGADADMLQALSMRERISGRVAAALIPSGGPGAAAEAARSGGCFDRRGVAGRAGGWPGAGRCRSAGGAAGSP